MKLSILAGSTSQSVNVFIRDSTSTTGAGLAAVAPAGGSLLTGTKLYYSFTGANATAGVAVALAVLATVGAAYSSAGIVTLDATNMIGWVRIDIPNAALAGSKGRVVSFHLYGGTNMAPVPFEIELTAVDNQSATAFMTSVATVTTLTNLPAIPANWITAAGITAAALNGKGDWSTVAPTNLTAAQIATGVWQDATAGDFTVGLSIGKSLYTTGNAPGAASGIALNGDAMSLTAGERTTLTAAIWAFVVTGTTTAVQAMRGMMSAMLGKASGLSTNAPVYRDIADTKNVIVATTDASGDRTVVTLDLS